MYVVYYWTADEGGTHWRIVSKSDDHVWSYSRMPEKDIHAVLKHIAPFLQGERFKFEHKNPDA